LLERVGFICLMGGYPSKSNFGHLWSAKLARYYLRSHTYKTDDISQPLLIKSGEGSLTFLSS
jgi:hypothetical protein